MNKITKKLISKAIKVLSWSIGLSLILSLLIGGINAYGIPYQGMDMPIRLQDNENIIWPEFIEGENKLFGKNDRVIITDKSIIFKALWSYIGEGVRIGRGPPKYESSHLLLESESEEKKPLLIRI